MIEWQYLRKGRWVTLHKRSKNANRPFGYAQRLRKAGRWRVRRAVQRRAAVRRRAFGAARLPRALSSRAWPARAAAEREQVVAESEVSGPRRLAFHDLERVAERDTVLGHGAKHLGSEPDTCTKRPRAPARVPQRLGLPR